MISWPLSRAKGQVPVRVQAGARDETQRLDLRQEPPLPDGFLSLGEFTLGDGDSCLVTISTGDAQGLATADAVQFLRVGD